MCVCNHGMRSSRAARIRGESDCMGTAKMEVGEVLDVVALLSKETVVIKKKFGDLNTGGR